MVSHSYYSNDELLSITPLLGERFFVPLLVLYILWLLYQFHGS